MSIFGDIISSAIKPVTELIGKIVMKDEEKQKLTIEMQKAQNELQVKVLEAYDKELQANKEVVLAEVQGKSWMQRNWRPMLMFVFEAILVNNYILFPYLSAFFPKTVHILEYPPQFWNLMLVAIGGYLGARTLEKYKENKK